MYIIFRLPTLALSNRLEGYNLSLENQSTPDLLS